MIKFFSGIVSGSIATAVMSLFMYVAAGMGFVAVAPQELAAYVWTLGPAMAWAVHFLMGILLALLYIFIFRRMLRVIDSVLLKGFIFGLIAFLIAQIGYFGLEQAAYEMPTSTDNDMVLAVTSSLIGHLIFGIIVALISRPKATTD